MGHTRLCAAARRPPLSNAGPLPVPAGCCASSRVTGSSCQAQPTGAHDAWQPMASRVPAPPAQGPGQRARAARRHIIHNTRRPTRIQLASTASVTAHPGSQIKQDHTGAPKIAHAAHTAGALCPATWLVRAWWFPKHPQLGGPMAEAALRSRDCTSNIGLLCKTERSPRTPQLSSCARKGAGKMGSWWLALVPGRRRLCAASAPPPPFPLRHAPTMHPGSQLPSPCCIHACMGMLLLLVVLLFCYRARARPSHAPPPFPLTAAASLLPR